VTAIAVPLAVPAAIRSPRASAAVALTVAGALAVAAGAALPWVVLFRGLRPIAGFQLEGGILAAVAVAAAALPTAAGRLGGARLLRPLAVLAGLLVAADAVLNGVRIAAYVADPGPAGPLAQPAAGAGPWVMAAGGVLLAAAAAVAPVPHRRIDRGGVVRLALAAVLLTAGAIHLLLTPEHLAEATLLGLGFLAAGLAQLALAALIVLRPPGDLVLTAAVTVTVALVALYVYAVLVGLPFGESGEHEEAAGLVLGAGEPVDWWGFVDLVAELAALPLAAVLLRSGAGEQELTAAA
jgi:hypothetical protein